MMKGIIDFLLSNSPEAKLLRQYYIFRIIPMLNPDGVIYGNYRCCLLGYDLNRRWKIPDHHFQPTVFYAKEMIRVMSEERPISLFCDLHGHSMQKNVFMYGCTSSPTDPNCIAKNAAVRVIPLMMAHMNPNFSYKFSRFIMEKYKESTARIVLFKEFNITNSYTCEASFFR